MANLPSQYEWLNNEGAPKMIVEALLLYGTIETPGAANNQTIINWANEVGGKVTDVYKADSIPWCGLFMAVVAKRAGKEVPKDPLWALNWSAFGNRVEQAMLGDTLVFVRKGGGHVGIYIGEDKAAYHVLGGNTSDKVSIARIDKKRLYTISRPIYSIAQPPNVRRIFLSEKGMLSINES